MSSYKKLPNRYVLKINLGHSSSLTPVKLGYERKVLRAACKQLDFAIKSTVLSHLVVACDKYNLDRCPLQLRDIATRRSEAPNLTRILEIRSLTKEFQVDLCGRRVISKADGTFEYEKEAAYGLELTLAEDDVKTFLRPALLSLQRIRKILSVILSSLQFNSLMPHFQLEYQRRGVRMDKGGSSRVSARLALIGRPSHPPARWPTSKYCFPSPLRAAQDRSFWNVFRLSTSGRPSARLSHSPVPTARPCGYRQWEVSACFKYSLPPRSLWRVTSGAAT